MLAVISPDLDKAARALNALHRKILQEAEESIGQALLFLKAEVQEGIRDGKKGKGAKRAIQRRSGTLSGSINTRTKRLATTVRGFIGTWHPGAALLDLGGTVVPKRKKWLTIPFRTEGGDPGPALTPAGVPRGKARDWDLRFVPTKRVPPTAFLFSSEADYDPESRTWSEPPYFTLKKKVEIPESKFFRGPIEANREKVLDFIQEGARRAAKKAGLDAKER